MKKILYFAAVLSAFMTSCNSDNEIIDSKPTKVTSTITATFDQPATRVRMGESDGSNTPLQWNAGDQLAVYNVTSRTYGKYAAASTVRDGDLSASFNFVEQAGTSEIVPEEAHLAAYPFDRIAASTFEFRYSTTQTYTANSFDPLAMPMVASNASGTEFSFKAQAAVLRLKVSTTASDVTVSSIDITSASNALTGYAAPDMVNGTYGVPTENTSNTVTLNCATPVAINSTAKEFNIVVPGQTYPSGGLTITVKTNKGTIKKTSKAAATFEAGKVYNLNISGVPTNYVEWESLTKYNEWLPLTSTNRKYVTSIVIQTNRDFPAEDPTVKELVNDLWSRYVKNDTYYTVYIETSQEVIKATSLESTFRNFSGLTSISGLDNIDVSNASSFSNCFQASSKLTSLDLTSWQIKNDAPTQNMFRNLSVLTSLTLNNTFHAGGYMFFCVGDNLTGDEKCKVYGVTDDAVKADLEQDSPINTYWSYSENKIEWGN